MDLRSQKRKLRLTPRTVMGAIFNSYARVQKTSRTPKRRSSKKGLKKSWDKSTSKNVIPKKTLTAKSDAAPLPDVQTSAREIKSEVPDKPNTSSQHDVPTEPAHTEEKKRYKRQKRLRLSELNLSSVLDKSELDSFSEGVVSKVKALVKGKANPDNSTSLVDTNKNCIKNRDERSSEELKHSTRRKGKLRFSELHAPPAADISDLNFFTENVICKIKDLIQAKSHDKERSTFNGQNNSFRSKSSTNQEKSNGLLNTSQPLGSTSKTEGFDYRNADGHNQIYSHGTKRKRLSDIHISEISNVEELDSFTESVVTKVKAVVEKKRRLQSTFAENDTNKIVKKTMNSTEIHIESPPKITQRRDVATSTSPGPLDISRISHSALNGASPSANFSRVLQGERSTTKYQKMSNINGFNQKPRPISPQAVNQDSSLTRSRGMHNSSLQDLVIEADQEEAVVDAALEKLEASYAELANTPYQKEKSSNSVTDKHGILTSTPRQKKKPNNSAVWKEVDKSKVAAPCSSNPKPIKKARRRNQDNGLPFSTTHLKHLVKTYSSLPSTRKWIKNIEEASRLYFEQTAKYFVNECESRKKRKRHCVNLKDVEALMKRRRNITTKRTLNLMIEDNFPLEYRESLIPVAASGNVKILK